MKKFIFTVLIGLLMVLTIAPAEVSAADTSELDQPLQTMAEANDLMIGTAVRYWSLESDPIYCEFLEREFNVITVENMMKFKYIHPGQDEYDFTKADAIVDFAQQNNIKVRGHCLVWNQELPLWLTEGDWSRDELKAILKDHIKTVVKYYRGRVFAWDVLNEAVAGGGRIRETFWHQGIGQEYLGMIFRWAHQADPNALLFYNDYQCEGLGDKSDGVYDLMKNLVNYNIPIDGIGLQMHLNVDDHPTPEEITANMERLAALGLEIHITEMTVCIRDEVTQEELEKQAEIYGDIMEVCLSVDACTTFVMWGFTDLHSHLSDNPNRGSALIFDESYQPKQAYYALVDVLKPPKPTLNFTDITPNTITTSTAPYDATLSASGTNFNNVNQITLSWSGAANGSMTWNEGDSSWGSKVTINSDTSMTLVFRVAPTSPSWSGTLTFTVTLKDNTAATASQSFLVTYTPPEEEPPEEEPEEEPPEEEPETPPQQPELPWWYWWWFRR